MSNLFHIGGPVKDPKKFFCRTAEIEKLRGCISQGCSSIIVGDPRIGKSSLLHCVFADSVRDKLLREDVRELHLKYLDAQTFPIDFSPAQFWQYVIEDLYEDKLESRQDLNSELIRNYKRLKKSGFAETSLLESFFYYLDEVKWRVVVLIDEFDVVLNRPKLNDPAFLGCLRSYSSRIASLSLILATRNSVVALNNATKDVSAQLFQGSPYFNTYTEIALGPFSDKDSSLFTEYASDRLLAVDREYLFSLTGGYPYFLQVATYALCKAYGKFPLDAYRRWQYVIDELNSEVNKTLDDVWALWSEKTRIAFMAVGLPQIALEFPKFRQRDLTDALSEYKGELEYLNKRGWIVKNDATGGRWRVRPQSALFWLAKQITKESYAEISAKEWLQKRQLDGVLTYEQKKEWGEKLSWIGEVLKDGVKTLTEATAKGFAEAYTSQ